MIAKTNPIEVYKCWEAASYGRAVHFEYNKQGTEVWVSIWGDASKPGEVGEIVIYDDATLEGDRPHPGPGDPYREVQCV